MFWPLNLVWVFPWGVAMLFFTFSTTQEYYSMPIYPALALSIGSAISLHFRIAPEILDAIPTGEIPRTPRTFACKECST
jgi:hypothetical protein